MLNTQYYYSKLCLFLRRSFSLQLNQKIRLRDQQPNLFDLFLVTFIIIFLLAIVILLRRYKPDQVIKKMK